MVWAGCPVLQEGTIMVPDYSGHFMPQQDPSLQPLSLAGTAVTTWPSHCSW